jgi:lipopolysaccharide export system protein LptA
MRNRVERLRVWLVGSAVFLMLVIGAFIGTARYLRHLLLADLPGKLGINVVSDASGWTVSQSRGSQTLYTIHAAKWEQRADKKLVLHDVSIMLYGTKGTRHDHVYGDEFEYDKDAGVVRATGVVHMDLQAAGAAGNAPQEDDSGAKLMHVKTSGLVYLEKLGVAATSEYIEFQAGGLTGHASGADYSSDSGMLMLHSAVNMTGTAGGRPLNLTAATAEFDDQRQQAHMTHAKYDSQGRTAAADDVTLHRRKDGTLSRVEAHGNVAGEANGARVISQRADVAMTAASQPQTAVLTGGVRYSSEGPLRQMKGESDAATIAFDGQAKPQPTHALFTGAVHVTERTRAMVALQEPWSTRNLTAGRLDVALARGAKGDAQVRDAAATGSPHLTMVNNGSLASSRGQGTTELSADDLKAHLIASADPKQPPQVDTIVGRGHTVLHQLSADGVEQTTAGDTLDAKMRPGTADGAAKRVGALVPAGQSFADSLSNAVQVGHVTMMHRSPAKPKAGTKAATPEEVVHASAQRAVYDGDQDRVTLTGGVAMADASSGLWADQVVMDHKTSDAHAVGGVKMNYVQDASPGRGGQQDQPTHILADRAEIQHATKIATFYGKPVRMWQGGNQVQAPVIEVAQAEKRLTARGEGAGQVHTVLAAGTSEVAGTGTAGAVSACSAAVALTGGAKAAPGAEAKAPDVVRVASGGLVYSDNLQQADFTGGFRADTVDGTIRAGAGTVYMQKKAANAVEGGDAAAVPSLGGNLDRVVAAGHVELDKPGMHATGERLVYTARDRMVLLTGDAKDPPKAVGAQGTTTGAALRFNACDGSVEALGATGQRVLTDAKISNEEKKEKGKR